MPVASNSLLQASAPAKPSRVATGAPEKSPQASNDKAGGFSQVYAKESREANATAGDPPLRENASATPASVNDGKKTAGDDAKVADSGKKLPEEQDGAEADPALSADPTLLDSSLVAGQVTDAQPGAQLIQAQAEAVAPVVQAAAQLQVQPAVVASPAAEAVLEPQAAFDPEADPLADLPALRLALEQSAQAQGTTSTHAAKPAAAQPEAMPAQPAVNTLAALLDKPGADAEQGEPGEKAFSGLIDDGLKDLKSASSDTRVDNFAERLSSLTQAATAKTANAVPVATPLNQPLAMNQGGWTEGLVNRVMYLSSQNLKSADIKLEPAELGRLDIRVNLAPEQQAQVTFVSGHAGVREALENQVHRLKEMFAQQGLGQPDVNVADQSRGGQQQGAQDAPKFSGVAARRNEAGESAEIAPGAMPVEQQSVVGSSAVDYYA
ncbi:flagellar hook-length control protein FliK [Pseudomonas donghuensis]|uniref:flagellar hook-length control protein FliK n=1 Tax=Pseudomonas donghuensis TaxID=1163398 RepID=UPI00029B41BD|nr:flagellar hook-length control protein FliK [Pseudomonas donghuensis]PJY94189.1 flagellar hook-length control protein FliK [Pseudomonas donghuensis]UVL25835.1 flagellar hook-length control protein FliK [Pseudomonas donghuensis]UVL30981.1 flagellar hook-length control protein FliK [Pseudomonas donghuensis]WKY29911.1 flagellar hook-length control protein FliK [Pseudomonas donghuensis]